MELIENIKLKQRVDKALHVPGNFTGKNLEMCVVVDWNNDKQEVKQLIISIMKTLKRHSEVFNNVRLNVVSWISDEEILSDVIPMPIMIMGKYFDRYEKNENEKLNDNLIKYLRKFQARSKLIIVVADKKSKTLNEEEINRDIHPFLIKKTIWIVEGKVQ